MARPSATFAAPAADTDAETAADGVDADSVDAGQEQGARPDAAPEGPPAPPPPPLPAADDLGLAPGLPVMQDPPGSGASGSLLELLLADEEPPSADASAPADVAAVPCSDAEPPPPQVAGLCYPLHRQSRRMPMPC